MGRRATVTVAAAALALGLAACGSSPTTADGTARPTAGTAFYTPPSPL